MIDRIPRNENPAKAETRSDFLRMRPSAPQEFSSPAAREPRQELGP